MTARRLAILLSFGLLTLVPLVPLIPLIPLGAHAAAAAPHRTLAADFTLSDQSGRPFRLARQRGRVVVLFFGYTHCPDVCPTTLAHLARARSALGGAGRGVRIVLVTVDARRDTPAALRRFVALFDPSVVGLTGTPEQLDSVYRAYHVARRIVKTGAGGGYDVSHTSYVYFVGRDGRIRGFGDWSDSAESFEESLRDLL